MCLLSFSGLNLEALDNHLKLSFLCRTKAEEEKAAALKAAQEYEERMARDRFGNAKSISSAQFEDNNDEFRNQENQVILPRL